MEGLLKVTSVKEFKGQVYGSDCYPNQYNSGRMYNITQDPKCLLIRGLLDGVDTSFFTPTVIIKEFKGYLNSKQMRKNSWFELIEGETTGHRGHKMFDGGSTPNYALNTPAEIVRKVNEGDEIRIAYHEKGEFRGTKTIKRVRVLN